MSKLLEFIWILSIFREVVLRNLFLYYYSRSSSFIHFETKTKFRNYFARISYIIFPVWVFRSKWKFLKFKESRLNVKKWMLLPVMAWQITFTVFQPLSTNWTKLVKRRFTIWFDNFQDSMLSGLALNSTIMYLRIFFVSLLLLFLHSTLTSSQAIKFLNLFISLM